MNIATIQRRIGMIQKFQDESRIAKDTLKQTLEDDPSYREAQLAAKETASKKKQIKDQIWAQPGNKALLEDIKVNNEEIATLQTILNSELADYYFKNGKEEIEDESGTPIRFKLIAKLLPRGFTEQSERSHRPTGA